MEQLTVEERTLLRVIDERDTALKQVALYLETIDTLDAENQKLRGDTWNYTIQIRDLERQLHGIAERDDFTKRMLAEAEVADLKRQLAERERQAGVLTEVIQQRTEAIDRQHNTIIGMQNKLDMRAITIERQDTMLASYHRLVANLHRRMAHLATTRDK